MNQIRTCKFAYILLLSTFILSCGSEDIIIDNAPKSLSLSHAFIYENLPAETNVAQLSTDSDITNPKYRLVSGEGADDNGDFIISSVYLQSRKAFAFKENAIKRIRIRVNNGAEFFEQDFEIELKPYQHDYPKITSNSFMDRSEMPREFGADNGNISPDLLIENPNEAAVSMAIIMTDLDDNASIHWAVWNIPIEMTVIKRNQAWNEGITVGNNTFGDGYIGPFPPSKHRYEISIYYLNSLLPLEPSDFRMLEIEMIGTLTAQASIIGTYSP